MKTITNIKNIVSEKMAGFFEKTPGIAAFIVTLVIVALIVT